MLSLRSVKCSLHAPRSRSHQRHHSAFRASHLAQPPSTCTSAHNQCDSSTSAALPHQPDPAPLSFRRPVVLPSYHPNPAHDSSAPRRGLMSSGAAQLPSHRGGVMGLPSAADAATRASFGCPSGGRRRRAVQDVRTPATPFVALFASAVRHADGRPSNWSGGRPVSARPVSMRLVSTRPV